MGMAYMGLTHCEKCYKPLKDDEYVFCKKCEEENRKKDKSMKMKYKGYELLKAIADGEIKEGSLILFDSIIWIVDEYSDIVKYQEEHITLFNTYKAKEIAMSDFELIEDEIDIDSIEELEGIVEYSTERNTINQLIQAVKQIDKRVKKIEEK